MCGIAGGIGINHPKKLTLEKQLEVLRHRGPDETGTFFSKELSLGICRLAIVEVESAKQPATDESKIINLVWNGEIYNFRELRNELLAKGIVFTSKSESEVIIKLFLLHGLEFVSKLDGMFAIAIYDSRTHSLHLIRDRVGEKPLWITKDDKGTLFFASEIKALLQLNIEFGMRYEMIPEVLFYGYIPGNESTFHDIKQVPPAHILSWQNNKIIFFQYWKPKFFPKNNLSRSEVLVQAKNLIEESVSLRLNSDRPIGAFLSGGLDSTIITYYMAKLTSKAVQTFTLGFETNRYNEANYARNIANFLGTHHHEYYIGSDPQLILEEIGVQMDQPFADSSLIASFALSQFIKKNNVTVALGGDGGDEIFGGYSRYIFASKLQKINYLLKLNHFDNHGLWVDFVFNFKDPKYKVSRFKYQRNLGQRYLDIMSMNTLSDVELILNHNLKKFNYLNKYFVNFEMENILSDLDKMTKYDFDNYLPSDLLVKSDRSSMFNSVELRSPFLDHKIVEFGLTLPENLKILRYKSKFVLREIAMELLPISLVDRPKKGFSIPRSEWLRIQLYDLMNDLLTDSTARNRGWFDYRQVKSLIRQHKSGKNRDDLLWPMIMIELWARNWVDS